MLRTGFYRAVIESKELRFWGCFGRVPEGVVCLPGLRDYLLACGFRLRHLLSLPVNYIPLVDTPVSCLESAGHWESEIIQAWYARHSRWAWLHSSWFTGLLLLNFWRLKFVWLPRYFQFLPLFSRTLRGDEDFGLHSCETKYFVFPGGVDDLGFRAVVKYGEILLLNPTYAV